MKITLKAARVNAGMTQKLVADRLGVSRCTILNWENGKQNIGIPQFTSLCGVYGVKAEDIFLPTNSTKCRKGEVG